MVRSATKNAEVWALPDDGDLAAIVKAAADISVVLDPGDVVIEASHTLDPSIGEEIAGWRGRPVEEIVGDASRPALRRMLRLARDARPVPRLDVSHELSGTAPLPVRYSAVRLGTTGRVALFGQDRREEAALRARLASSRQTLEQTARLQRQSDAHYRLLFETAAAPMVMVDGQSGKIRDINPRAAALFGTTPAQVSARRVSVLVSRGDQSELMQTVAGVAGTGSPLSVEVRSAAGGLVRIDADPFRAGDLKMVLMRICPVDGHDNEQDDNSIALDALLRQAPDAIVLTDEEGLAIWANEAFLALSGIPTSAQLFGRPLDALFQWHGAEKEIALQSARREGSVAAFASTLAAEHGKRVDVEMSVVALSGANAGYGFVMRPVPPGNARLAPPSDLAQTAGGLIELVGRVPLKDLVRDQTDIIERMCIEAALRITGNNRAAAARALGLSRQAFYLKLDRFGIGSAD